MFGRQLALILKTTKISPIYLTQIQPFASQKYSKTGARLKTAHVSHATPQAVTPNPAVGSAPTPVSTVQDKDKVKVSEEAIHTAANTPVVQKAWYEYLLTGEKPPALVPIVPEEPVSVHPSLTPQHDYKDPMPGQLIYGLNSKAFFKVQTQLAMPAGTAFVCLAALSFYHWDIPATVVWVLSLGASGYNTFAQKDTLTRMSVSTSTKKDTRDYPRHRLSPLDMKEITTLHIERIGYPFAKRTREELEILPMERVPDASYLKDCVFPGDVVNASSSLMYERVIADRGGKRYMFFVDQIRHCDYFNQFLTYVRNVREIKL